MNRVTSGSLKPELEAICAQMARRGPDGGGVWESADGRIALGHRRLAIIDLSDRAAQPMHSSDGKLFITFNGEIYNHVALRRDLEQRGHQFRTTSDTEVLLHLYAAHGQDMLRYLRGMFAFAIWDERRQGLFLARDPFGIKPLYYAYDGGVLRFASQVRALLAGGGVSKSRDPAGLAGFFLWGSVPEPFTCYEAIRALPAGSSLWVKDSSKPDPHVYFSVAEAWSSSSPAKQSTNEAVATLQEALRDSVAHHLVSDVPVSAFLSGGIDSGALVGLMSEHAGPGIHGITLQFAEFEGRANDETPLARLIAQRYGIRHHVRQVTHAEFVAELPAIFAAMDQPSIDGVNTWFVSKATAELGLKVAVSGLGGDELFGGYSSFREIPQMVRATRMFALAPALGRGLRVLSAAALDRLHWTHPKLSSVPEYGGTYSGAYLLKRGLFMPWELPQLLPQDVADEGLRRLQPLERLEELLNPLPRSPFARVAALEASQYMRNQLLRDSDWASMAHSLEVRVPLVDSVLLERVAPLFATEHNHLGKSVLAATPKPELPAEVRNRPKTGFSTPTEQWLKHSELLSSWRRIPLLRRKNCPWARRYAYAVAQCVDSGNF